MDDQGVERDGPRCPDEGKEAEAGQPVRVDKGPHEGAEPEVHPGPVGDKGGVDELCVSGRVDGKVGRVGLVLGLCPGKDPARDERVEGLGKRVAVKGGGGERKLKAEELAQKVGVPPEL